MLSAGVPMILGGDEIARSQGGNNNAYCQDDEISWFDWAAADQELLAFTRAAIAFRKQHIALRPEWYRTAPGDSESTVSVLRADNAGFEDADWADGGNRAVMLVLEQGDDAVAVLLNASDTTVEFTLPSKPGGGSWSLALSSDPTQQVAGDATTVLVRDASFTALD
jgi:glycogen operon protein